jgi:hypothetical protein
MIDSVMAKDTHTHERIAVQKWFHRKNTSCSGILLLTLLVIARTFWCLYTYYTCLITVV